MIDDNDFILKRDFYNEHNLEYLIEQGKKGEDRTTAGELQYTSNVFEDNPFI